MHLIMLCLALGFSLCVRLAWSESDGDWAKQWSATLLVFLLPPLLLLTTAIALLWMGPKGFMLGNQADWLSYSLACGFLLLTVLLCLKLGWAGWQMVRQLRTEPAIDLQGKTIHVVNLLTPYSAQIGFWNPELVMSRGLLDNLEQPHLNAILLHETAHHHYHDTFWFFWLGCMRRLTAWLPKTTIIWEKLLMLRELRADHWAKQYTDGLLLAEALLQVVQQSPTIYPPELCAAFGDQASGSRLTQRIEALLSPTETIASSSQWTQMWLLVTLLPLAAVPFHG